MPVEELESLKQLLKSFAKRTLLKMMRLTKSDFEKAMLIVEETIRDIQQNNEVEKSKAEFFNKLREI